MRRRGTDECVGPTIVFAGGGTGGHLFPGLAVAEELGRRLPALRVVFCGSGRGVECRIVATAGYVHRALEIESPRTLTRRPLRFVRGFWSALSQARRVLSAERPAAVIGLGGFASYPLVRAASAQRTPVVLLEQNVIAGRATRWLSRRARRICLSFDDSLQTLRPAVRARCCVTGNPVRPAIRELAERSLAARSAADAPQLLILGGSQGAVAVNRAVLEAIRGSAILQRCRIVHQTGQPDWEFVRGEYKRLKLCEAEVSPFFEDMPARYAAADLVVSRAGATSLAELACAGVASVLIPYPHAADGHQQRNAGVFVESDAAVLVKQAGDVERTASRLTKVLERLVSDPQQRQLMAQRMRALARPNAAQHVADEILRVISHRGP